jgi:hypothetical protein
VALIKLNNKLITFGGKLLSVSIPYDITVNSLINRMISTGETPTYQRQYLIYNTIISAKSKPFWNKLNGVWCFASHGLSSSKMNWINDTYNCVTYNSPSFTIDQGFTGNGLNTRIDTGFQPLYSGPVNNSSYGFYSRTNVDENRIDMSNMNSSGSGTLMMSRSGNTFKGRINTAAGTEISVPNTDSIGLFTMSRESSTLVKSYKNKIKIDESTTLATGSGSGTITIGCGVYYHGFNYFSTKQYSFAFASNNGITETDVTDIYDVFVDGYLNSIGAKI